MNPQTARQFATGATRSDDSAKPNYIGYLSPLVIERFGRYMLEHQYGGQRSADNWKKGITKQAYIESLVRHLVSLWLLHEGYPERVELLESIEDQKAECLCALLFNVQGYLHDHLKRFPQVDPPLPENRGGPCRHHSGLPCEYCGAGF